jgi:electron transport complex protein RnfD
MSVTEAARTLGVGRPALSNFLNGKAAATSAMASRIERAFGVAAQTLLDMQATYDAVSSATPLGLMKFEHQSTPLWDLVIGNTSGCIGETSGLLLILGGVYLLLRRDLDWRIPASILLTVAAFSLILYLVDSARYPGPLFSLFSGGLLIGAIYMASDPVTSPITPRGAWIFGIGVGLLVLLIRVYGGFPEGVMYAILLMNAATPLLNRYTQPRVFGRESGTR